MLLHTFHIIIESLPVILRVCFAFFLTVIVPVTYFIPMRTFLWGATAIARYVAPIIVGASAVILVRDPVATRVVDSRLGTGAARFDHIVLD